MELSPERPPKRDETGDRTAGSFHPDRSVGDGYFHDFHQAWIIEIRNALNSGGLPPGFFAMAEQIVSGPIPAVVTLKGRTTHVPPQPGGGIAVADASRQARFIVSAEADLYASKADRIVIKHRLGEVVALIEIVSPGNK